MKFIVIGLLLCLVCAVAAEDLVEEPEEELIVLDPESDADADEFEPLPIAGFTYESGIYALSTVVKVICHDRFVHIVDFYIPVILQLNWFQAHAACAAQSYDLASVPTQNSELRLYNFLLTSGLANLLTEPIWTAGANLAVSTQWSWYNTGDPFNYMNFEDTASTVHSCLAFNATTSLWTAEACSSKRYFVCQKRCTR